MCEYTLHVSKNIFYHIIIQTLSHIKKIRSNKYIINTEKYSLKIFIKNLDFPPKNSGIFRKFGNFWKIWEFFENSGIFGKFGNIRLILH